MILKNPNSLTKLDVWFPRYHDLYTETRERVALLHKDKVDKATPVVLVEFTKAKHLLGQRFAITKEKAQSYPIGSNGIAPMYLVPMSAFDSWETQREVYEIANNLFEE